MLADELIADDIGRALSEGTVLNGVGARSSSDANQVMPMLEREQAARANKKIFRRSQVYGDGDNTVLPGSSAVSRRDDNATQRSTMVPASSYTK